MIFPFMGERGDKHCLMHFTVLFDVCLCIFCLKRFSLNTGYFCQRSLYFLSSVCSIAACHQRMLKRGAGFNQAFFFFFHYRHFDYSFAQMFMSCFIQFPVWNCVTVYISSIRIAYLIYYSWSFISATWMWM